MERVAGSVMAAAPALAATAPPPAHVVEAFGVGATRTPEGNVSTSAAERLAAAMFVLVSVMVSVDVPLAAMVPGAKSFATVGATAFTLSVALAAAALLPLDVCSA